MVDSIKSYTSSQNAYGNVGTQNNTPKTLKANLPDSDKIQQLLSDAKNNPPSEDAILTSISSKSVDDAQNLFTEQAEIFEKKEELRNNSRGLA